MSHVWWRKVYWDCMVRWFGSKCGKWLKEADKKDLVEIFCNQLMFRSSIQLLPHQKNLVPISKPIVSQAGSWRQDPGCVEGGGSWLRCAQTAPTATQQHQGSWSSHSWDLCPWWTLSFRWFGLHAPAIRRRLWSPTIFCECFDLGRNGYHLMETIASLFAPVIIGGCFILQPVISFSWQDGSINV